MQPAGTAQTTANANRVDSNYGAVDEWFVNGPSGLEQGFTLAPLPQADAGEALTVELSLSGDLTGTVNAAGADPATHRHRWPGGLQLGDRHRARGDGDQPDMRFAGGQHHGNHHRHQFRRHHGGGFRQRGRGQFHRAFGHQDHRHQPGGISRRRGCESDHGQTSTLPAAYTPYQVTYAYAGDANFTSISNGTTTTLTVNGVQEPVYRLYSPVTLEHLYTTDPNEYNTLRNAPWNWNDEGIVGYVFPTAVASSVPLYRMMAPQVHLWTTDVNEYDTLQSEGWTQEGCIGYVI